MASEQRRHGDKNRKQNPRNKTTTGLPREPSDLSTFDKLMMYFTKTNPEYSISNFTEALYAYRQERQTLAGLSLSQIEEGVLNIVRSKYPSKQNNIDTNQIENSVEDNTEQSVTAALWSTFRRYREREQLSKKTEHNTTTNNNNEPAITEDQCLICLESLNSNKTETFPCNHTFHRICLEEWFKIERTCPLCLGKGEGDVNRQRRQGVDGNNLNTGILSRNSDRFISSNNVQFIPSNNPNMAVSNDRNNQQQSNNNLLASSQGQAPIVRSRGFYDSPAFKPPSFSGEKPVGWFDTKYPNWVSNQNGQLDQNNVVNGKNGAPSSLQGKFIQPNREDGGPALLQKVAKHYASKGDKAYNFDGQHGRGSVCYNDQNYNGYTFGKFRCPLPASTGMNQHDEYCCGSANYQYCCNAQEFRQGQNDVFDNNRHSRHYHHSRTLNRALAVILPFVGILVIAGAGIIIFFYYKKLQKEHNKHSKSSAVTRLNDNYSAIPQDVPVERPIINQHEQQNTSVQA
ncbi:unnamed protein product [Rotaria sp. Silwood1]|nr:unnamed protein product [Rotaria sp. Silwood1]CAF4564851.1 unnamed protein product [Rotaria sp. Silwood1]